MPPNKVAAEFRRNSYADDGCRATVRAGIEISIEHGFLSVCGSAAHVLRVAVLCAITLVGAIGQDDVLVESELFLTNPSGSSSNHLDQPGTDSKRVVGSGLRVAADSRISDQDQPFLSPSVSSEEVVRRLNALATSDPSPLVRETSRLQLIEMQYADRSSVLEENGSTEQVSPNVLTRDKFPGKKRVAGLRSRAAAVESVLSGFSIYQPQDLLIPPDPPDALIQLNRQNPKPDVLRSPYPPGAEVDEFEPGREQRMSVETIFAAPLGFTGPSGVLPTESQQSLDFVPIEDRWRTGFPEWDRYGKGNPPVDDQPYEVGHWWDPYNQNVLKGDYPIIGQHTFLNITATNEMLNEFREVPTPTTPFESTRNPDEQEFFGNPKQYFFLNNLRLQFNLAHGDAGFKPFDWQVRFTPVFNLNYLDVKELGVVNPNVRHGTTRFRDFVAMEEWFAEAKLADLSPDYDFMSVRAGSQPFVSDFRGFIFADTNRAVRLFGTRLSNRDQFNLIFFDQTEKDTNSMLNTLNDRGQNTLIANYFRQDFIFPGYTAEFSFHYNNDQPTTKFDRNNFLVRPDPVGAFRPHRVEAYYFGVAGDGHIGRVNISHAFYHVEGRDSLNPIQGQASQIRADMGALELSIDRDWIRFRASGMWASGDNNPNDCKAEGFDAIFENPNFAGGNFSYWQRQAIRLFGVNLVQREGLLPDLRSSKTQGQSNFVNPGLQLLNAGMDFEITPKLKAITNANFLWFDTTETLEQLVYQSNIHRRIGTDLSLGMEYRPRLSDNVIVSGGVSTLIPGQGFHDLFGVANPVSAATAAPGKSDSMQALFVDVTFTY